MSDIPTGIDLRRPNPLPPSVDEAFGPPSIDDAFPPPTQPFIGDEFTMDGKFWDSIFESSHPGYILHRFAQGAAQGWGTQPLGFSDKDRKTLHDMGVSAQLFNDVDNGQKGVIRDFNEALLRSTAIAADVMLRRLPGAVIGGLGELVPPVRAAAEAFPAAHYTGFPIGVRGTPPPYARLLDDAAEVGILPKVRESFAPKGEDTATERFVAPGVPEDAPTDVHGLARVIAPDTFAKWDELAKQKEIFSTWLDEMTEARRSEPEAVRLQARINDTLGKVRGVEERLTKRAAARLEADRAALDDFLRTDTEDMRHIRQGRTAVDEQMRDMAPDVSAAYRDARDQMPPPDAPAAPPEPLPVADVIPLRPEPVAAQPEIITGQEIRDRYTKTAPEGGVGLVRAGDSYQDITEAGADLSKQAADTIAAGGRVIMHVEGKERPVVEVRNGGLIDENGNRWGIGGFMMSPKDSIEFRPAPATIANLAQRRPTIGADVTARLIEAGRPAEEARASAALWNAYYNARGARLGIPARQLFDEDAPEIRAGGSASQRGRFTFAEPRNIISVFEKADASTFMHESGHQWLEDLVRDARRLGAPAELKADLETVRQWLGATEERLTRAQHEKFARGFERYLMEGQAPSSNLVKVFEKFKQWLTQIYQTVARLRAPINNEIRGVYDRLLSRPNDEPVITKEREGARTFDEDHMASVNETPAAEAEARANEIRAERDRVALRLSEAIDNARREARRGKERSIVPREQGAGTSDVAGGKGAAEANEPLRTGREPPSGESEAPSTADTPFERGTGALVDKNGDIRMENLNEPDDVTAAIHQAIADRGGFVTERRGTLSDAQVAALADELGTDPKKINRRQVGQAFNAEEIEYAKRQVVIMETKVRDAAAKAAEGDTKALIEYGKARERLLMTMGQVMGIRAEAGRALRMFKDLEGMTGAGMLTEVFNKTVGTLKELQQEAILVKEMPTAKGTGKFLRDKNEPGWKDYIIEAWLNGLLSGPFTHVVNMVGNTSVMFGSVIEQAGAAGVSTLRGTNAVSYASVADRFMGIFQGSVDGMQAAGRALWDESVIEQAAHTVEQRRFQAIPSKKVNIGGIDWNVGGAQVRLPGRFLTAEDEFFRAVATRQELNVLARQEARRLGLTGDEADAHIANVIANPSEAQLTAARQYAAYQTFTKDLGPLGRSVQAFANSHPAAKFIIPFVRTPVNLFKYAVERSPAGFMMKEVRDNLSGANGEVAKDTQIARMALGTMTMGAVGYMAFNGLMSGGGPTDPAQQATLRRTGWQPYSVQIGNTWVPYARFDPISTTFGVAADMAEATKNGVAEDAELDKVAATLVANLGKNFIQKTSLRGVSSLIQAVVNPQQYGESWIESTAGSLIPAFSGQWARAEDPEMREVHGIVDAWKSRIPVWRESLFPKRDLGGDPVHESFTGWTGVSDDPVWNAMAKLGLGKAPPQRKIEGVKLTDQQYDDYAREGGRLGKMMADKIVASPGFASAPPAIQKKLISGAFDTGHDMARTKVMMGSLGSDNDIVKKGLDLMLKGLQPAHE